jgi:uncharacterized membrane protein YsdA (DUF1294 family)
LDEQINFYEFLELPGINKKVKRFTKKKSRVEAADLSRPAQSGGLPGACLAKVVSRHPIQIKRRGVIVPAALHARAIGGPAC